MLWSLDGRLNPRRTATVSLVFVTLCLLLYISGLLLLFRQPRLDVLPSAQTTDGRSSSSAVQKRNAVSPADDPNASDPANKIGIGGLLPIVPVPKPAAAPPVVVPTSPTPAAAAPATGGLLGSLLGGLLGGGSPAAVVPVVPIQPAAAPEPASNGGGLLGGLVGGVAALLSFVLFFS